MQANVPDRWERLAPISGIVFSVLLAVLFFGTDDEVARDASAEEVTSFYADQGETGAAIQYFLIGLAALALIWFAGSLRAYLARAEGGPGRLSVIAFGSGVAGAGLLAAAGAAFAGPLSTAVFSERSNLQIDPVVDEIVSSVGYVAFSYSLMAIGAMFAATAIAGLRSRSLPAWFSWVSLLVAVALAANIFYFVGVFALIVWMVVAAIVLMVRLRSPAASPP